MPGSKARVVIAGGGVAALESLAGLHALVAEGVETTLLAPEATFSYRPLSTARAFTFLERRDRRLSEIARDLGARFVRDALVAVDEERNRVLTRNGDFLDYDLLIVAVGARSPSRRPNDLKWRRDDQGMATLAALLQDLEAGALRRVALIVPRHAAWPVDAYELALIVRHAAIQAASATEVVLVTAENRPLEALGRGASEAIEQELGRASVDLATGTNALSRPSRKKRNAEALTLEVRPGSALEVTRALSLTPAVGPAVAGLPSDDRGFVPVDANSRVEGMSGIFAAGDATSLALKHSTLAANQATAAAHAVAAELDTRVEPRPWSPALHGILALPPHLPEAGTSAWLDDAIPVINCLWWPPGHATGRYLAPFLARQDKGVRPGLVWHPHGLPVAVEVGHTHAGPPPRAVSDEAMQHDARVRQLIAIRREEREGEQLEAELTRRLAEFERHEREVVARLREAGYLTHAGDRA